MKSISMMFFLFFSLVSFSQNSNPQVRDALTNSSDGMSTSGSWIPAKSVDKSIKGSQYLFANWVGQYKAVLKNGTSENIFNLNYNISKNKLESMIAKDSVFQYDLFQFDYIIKGTDKYKVISENNVYGLYLELYNDKSIIFYKQVVIGITEEVVNPMTQEPISGRTFEKKNLYYLFVNDKLEQIKLNKSDVLKYLKGKEKSIKNYVWDNNLSYTSEEDVIKILKYYNSIQ